MRLNGALRWVLVGFILSVLGNQAFEGAFIPATISLSLPAWVIAFRANVGVATDFLSPLSAHLVGRLGAFRALALVELVEGVLCLSVAALFMLHGKNGWVLLVLACVLLVTGQVVDVAAEVFEVDAAGGDDGMLIHYVGIVGVASSVVGVLAGRVAGSYLATISVTGALAFAGIASLGAALSRVLTRNRTAGSGEDEVDEEFVPRDRAVLLPLEGARRVALLACSGGLGLLPALWIAYTIRGLGIERGEALIPFLYGALGVGALLGSLAFHGFARRIGMRRMARSGAVLCLVGLLAASGPLAIAVVGFGLASAGSWAMAQAVVTSRQLLLSGQTLGRFVGRARLVYAAGASVGALVGWLSAEHFRWLTLGAACVACLMFVLARVLPVVAEQTAIPVDSQPDG